MPSWAAGRTVDYASYLLSQCGGKSANHQYDSLGRQCRIDDAYRRIRVSLLLAFNLLADIERYQRTNGAGQEVETQCRKPELD